MIDLYGHSVEIDTTGTGEGPWTGNYAFLSFVSDPQSQVPVVAVLIYKPTGNVQVHRADLIRFANWH